MVFKQVNTLDALPPFPSQRMIVTDLDGTLLHSERVLSAANRATLEALGDQGILRVIATGRSLYSARKVLSPSFPIDYLIFSSGAGIIDWPTQHMLVAHSLSAEEVTQASHALIQHELDFMLHHPIPDNHYFSYRTTGRENPDFFRRYELYRPFGAPLETSQPPVQPACQFVAISPKHPDALRKYDALKAHLQTLKVIRTTSPIDGESLWIEIFPTTVSKALASEWLARKYHIDRSKIFALGNDYNDLDLLQWAGKSAVVKNAPAELQAIYWTVTTNDDDGFSEAVRLWLNK
ncbi:HAD-IIB family hydrolase [candidate division KSB3 bacterium]|uniref:HAD-IIB family hydrolase n=1 Tax=candidate division KSB3 bacterium TaxID=2044937 RepID=A0A9D5Q578_9BACT|nr:HAD-IIB family hydrolase [candidate division KSB3 bacterium]MBD3324539.1 HAD-IIB family hydrolase [candidate division KSB3 bacterium]